MTAAAAALLWLAAGAGDGLLAPAAPPAPGPAAPAALAEAGLREPELIIGVPLVHTAGVLLGMRLGLSIIWPGPYDPLPVEKSTRQLAMGWSKPPEFRRDRNLLESDGDPWTINVLGHGLFGAEAYGRMRQCGGSALGSFAFAAAASVTWEYGLEAFSKRPSAVDLVLTPTLGAALGEGRYRLQRWLRGRKRGALRRVLEIVIDPLGEGERGLLGTRC